MSGLEASITSVRISITNLQISITDPMIEITDSINIITDSIVTIRNSITELGGSITRTTELRTVSCGRKAGALRLETTSSRLRTSQFRSPRAASPFADISLR
jgi:hypothetical protein